MFMSLFSPLAHCQMDSSLGTFPLLTLKELRKGKGTDPAIAYV